MAEAPGHPGAEPRWTSSRKSGVGTAIGTESDVWFTIAHGILNEVYYPSMDHAAIRDLGLLVTAAPDFFSEEKRHTHHEIRPIAPGVPGYELINTCEQGRYRIRKTVITDPHRNVLLQRIRFEALQGAARDYRVFALLAPHIGNQGADNHSWIGDYKGVPLLFAAREKTALSFGCSRGWIRRSCGYVGTSDGWHQLRTPGQVLHEYTSARGNIALTGELPGDPAGEWVLALGFGFTPAEAGHVVRAALLASFDEVAREFVDLWRMFQRTCLPLNAPTRGDFDLYRVSTATIKTHTSKRLHGGVCASLSIPWGNHRGDHDLTSYHLIWPRDQVRAAVAMLASGQAEAAREVLLHLICTQEADGRWPRDMWVTGEIFNPTTQGDQTAAVIQLADLLRRTDALGELNVWPTVQRAAEFLLRHGPVTEQDRWEESSGYAIFTLASTVAALLMAADFADAHHQPALANRCRHAADEWNAGIDRWLYVTDTELSRRLGIDGYYVRLAPPPVRSGVDLQIAHLHLCNYPRGHGFFPAAEIVSPDALALVRFGLRHADDPRILDTARAIDAALRTETRSGPAWKRFTHDGYGDHADGRGYDGTGVGHSWPLLTGERAHFELARGDRAEAERLRNAMAAQSNEAGLFPEQIWDAADLPAAGLVNGGPAGSAMPLVWAHAEFVTLLRSLRDGAVFDRPPQTVARYLSSAEKPGPRRIVLAERR
jgi:glucoamylase